MNKADKIEYRVRMVPRYFVTVYRESEGGRVGSCETRGEYENPDVAHEVAYALCKAEHDRLGWPVGDERIQYPRPYAEDQAYRETLADSAVQRLAASAI